jgi:hypothetical protein
VGVDWYTWRGQNLSPAINATIAYIRSLRANAMLVSFPFFMADSAASGVHAGPATPSPDQIATLAQAAERAGLYVSIRPLLDETALGRARTKWAPAHLRAWFASYRRFLLPYAAMAQRIHIPQMFIGTEFSQFGSSPQWPHLDEALADVYKGILAYAANWGKVQAHPGSHVLVTIDAYPPMPTLPPSAPQSQVTRAWVRYDRSLPRGVIESEVGIAAVAGAYALPFVHQWPTTQLDLTIQKRWFTAACRAAIEDHLGGIYFWAIGLGRSRGPTDVRQGAWAGTPAAGAISACFAPVTRRQR